MTDGSIFRIRQEELASGPCLVGYLRPADRLSTALLAEPNLLAEFREGLASQEQGMALIGKMPLWLACGVVASLLSEPPRPRQILVFEPRIANYVPVWPENFCRAWLDEMRAQQLGPASFLAPIGPSYSYHPAEEVFPSGQWPCAAAVLRAKTPENSEIGYPSVIEVSAVLETYLSQLDRPLLILDGPLPMWLAAAIMAQLAERTAPALLALRALPEGGSVVLRGNSSVPAGIVLPEAKSGKRPLFIGIVGDPNHGKSVLSWKLYRWLQKRNSFGVYRLDADAYSPTPGWSLNPLAHQLKTHYKRTRGPWTQKDHANLVRTLENLGRASLDLVLVDLPGGDHSTDLPQRVPPGRESVFQRIDKFILVHCDGSCRRDCRQGWYEALGQLGLGRSMLARVVSVLEGVESWPLLAGAATAENMDVPCWHVSKLTRELWGELTPATEHLANFLLELALARSQ